MKHIYIFPIFIGMVFLLHSCHTEENNNIPHERDGNQYAGGFQIDVDGQDYLLTVFNPWQNAENVQYEYRLSHEEKANCIKIPVESVVCMSTTHLGYLEVLNQRKSVKAISGTDFIFDETLRQSVDDGDIAELGFSENMNLEKLISLQPDLVFAYVVSPSELKQIEQIRSFGIPVVLVGDYLENHPLGKLEWLRFFAAFYDQLDEAEDFVVERESSYLEIQSQIESTDSKPNVILNVPWQGVWWMPGADSYMAGFIRDAGGVYMFDHLKGNASQTVEMEAVFEKAADVNVWLNPGTAKNCEQVYQSDSRLNAFQQYDNVRIYNNNKRTTVTSNDFYESAVVYPDLLLRDLMLIFHADSVPVDSLVYYQPM